MYKFYLHFAVGTGIDPTYTRKEIAEPIGFDAANWNLQQESGRYGRDVLFSPDSFTFSPFVEIQGLTHNFDDLVQVYQTRGFEANVLFEIEIDGTGYILGQLDFTSVDTDLIKYFTCTIIQLNDESIIKRRKEVKVDLCSDEDYNGQHITPLTPERILIRAQPLQQLSEWVMPDTPFTRTGGDPRLRFAPFNQIIKSQVQSTFSPTTGFIQATDINSEAFQDFRIIQADTKIEKGTLIFDGNYQNSGAGSLSFTVRKGINIASSEFIFNDTIDLNDANFYKEFNNIELNQGESIFAYFGYLSTVGGAFMTFHKMDVSFEATSIAYDSLTDGVRLIDAMKQVVKSISGLDVVAPRFDENGEHYEQYIFKGNQIRLIQDKPFTLSFEDLLKYIPEVNCDYQVNSDGTVFIGHETDFYTNQSAGTYPMSPNSVFNVKINERFTYNKIRYTYSKYEKGENEKQDNGLFGVNTELEMTVPNRFVENTKNIEVGFIRDAYLIEKTRRESILVTDNAPRLNDEDVFILDVIEVAELFRDEIFFVNHLLTGGQGLDLLGDGSFNWELLGFYVGLTFTLAGMDSENLGNYEVTAVDGSKLSLTKIGSPAPDFSGLALTQLLWILPTNLVNRTNEGFFPITPAAVEDGMANLKYASKRNLQKYWRGNIKAAAQFYPGDKVRNTFFRNGAEVIAQFMTETAFTSNTQDRDFLINLLGEPILSAFLVETQIIIDFDDFWAILQAVRNEKKYIEISDTKDNLIKLHPVELSYSVMDKLLTIKGEQRWQ